MHPSRKKRTRYLLLTLFVGVALLLTVFAFVARDRIAGTWFAEGFGGIVVISSDGTIQAGSGRGKYRRIGYSEYEIDFSPYALGFHEVVQVGRRGRSMTWVCSRRQIHFSKLSSKGVATVDQTVEEHEKARIVHRWAKGKSLQLLVIMPDGREGFDHDLLREYLNTKHGESIDALQWVSEFARWTGSGEIVNSLSEIPGYAEKPLATESRPPKPEMVRQGDPQGKETLQVITYGRLRGQVCLIKCEFDRGMCTTVKRRILGENVGAAYDKG